MPDKIPMTTDGFRKLQDKLSHLVNEVRNAVEKRLGEAREMGDLSENAEFSSAREELWQVDRKIAELKDQLSRVEIITTKNINPNEVAFGARVKVKDLDFKSEEEYILVGEGESNLAENKIAITTPIGQGLLGHKVGDQVKINVPAGTLSYQIIEIRYDS